ncbi:Coiled-coil domain-containing protein 158, partial [Struthio camelus australis]
SGTVSPFLSNQNVLASSVLNTVMETSASSNTGSSPPKTVFHSKYEMDFDSVKTTTGYPGKEHIEYTLEQYSQKVRDLQKSLNETSELHEQQKISLKQTISDLQTKLLEVQLERETLEDIRQRESQSQENIKIQLKTTIQELETANHLQEEMLREADSQTEHLKKMVHGHEEVLMELRGILMDYKNSAGKKLYEHENITSLHIHSLSTAFTEVLQDLDSEVLYLKEKVVLVEEELESLKKDSQTKTELLLQQHQNRIEQLVSEHEQEVAALTEKANSARSHANSIQSQMEIIQEQTRSRNSMHAHQVSELESTVSQLRSELREAKRMYEHKVEDLEKQLHQARSEMAEAQTERDQYSQESGNLDDQLHQLETPVRDSATESSMEQDTFSWDPLPLHTADLQSHDVSLPFTSTGGASIFLAAPRYTSSPKKISREERCKERSPVHSLLTTPADDLDAGPSASPERRPSLRKGGSPEGAATGTRITSQPTETSESTSRKLQNKMESLQNLVETLQMKNQAMSSMIRTQEKKIEKVKEKEKKLAK